MSSVSLNTATIEMVEGETFNLVATVLPKDAEYDGITWASSNASVASVNSGTVTALKEGTATITASAGGKSSTCNVKVSSKVIPVTSVALDKTSLSMQVGETETLTATVTPADATDKTVTWSSSDVSVATVADGKITAKKSGTATITAKSGNCTAECVVSVSVNTESVTLDKTTLSLAVGESAQLTATVSPADATDKNVTWASSDESVAKVADGKVTAVKSGKATITAKCGDKTAECAVTVTVPVASISLDKTTLSLAVGESAQLTATVIPADATDRDVTWTSSDESIVLVSDGKVKAIKVGSAVVTATVGNKSASCEITVCHPDNIIYYTAENGGNPVAPTNENAFGANLISNEYSDGIGRMVFDGSVTSIGKAAFMDCVKITSMQIPESVRKIGTSAFSGCSGLKTINTPINLTSIGSSAFRDCRSLLSYTLPNNIECIEWATFENCEKMIIDIPFPSSVKTIESSAFWGCYNIQKLILNDGLITIGAHAFRDCKGLKELVLPNSIEHLGQWAFQGCALEKLTIPGSIAHLSADPFYKNEYLLEVLIQEGVMTISEAFTYCKHLKRVTFPSTIEIMGSFAGCVSLSEVYVKAINPPIVDDDNLDDVNIWVPRSSVDAYKAAKGWSQYKDNIKGYDF